MVTHAAPTPARLEAPGLVAGDVHLVVRRELRVGVLRVHRPDERHEQVDRIDLGDLAGLGARHRLARPPGAAVVQGGLAPGAVGGPLDDVRAELVALPPDLDGLDEPLGQLRVLHAVDGVEVAEPPGRGQLVELLADLPQRGQGHDGGGGARRGGRGGDPDDRLALEGADHARDRGQRRSRPTGA